MLLYLVCITLKWSWHFDGNGTDAERTEVYLLLAKSKKWSFCFRPIGNATVSLSPLFFRLCMVTGIWGCKEDQLCVVCHFFGWAEGGTATTLPQRRAVDSGTVELDSRRPQANNYYSCHCCCCGTNVRRVSRQPRSWLCLNRVWE